MSWLVIAVGIAVIALVRKIKSPAIDPPAYRGLFLLVLIGFVLLSVLPEATFVIPAIDAVGLDIVTILVALELSHCLMLLSRMLGTPKFVVAYDRAPARMLVRCRCVARTNPLLWLYACTWALISLRAFLGTHLPRAN
jgi:hypothetical protein